MNTLNSSSSRLVILRISKITTRRKMKDDDEIIFHFPSSVSAVVAFALRHIYMHIVASRRKEINSYSQPIDQTK